MTEKTAFSLLSGPFASMLMGAGLVGFIAFGVGFFGPMFWSTSNLGPLFGIFFTGPVGVLIGALAGGVRWARDAHSPRVNAVWKWIAAIWLINLLYTLFMVRFAPQGMLFGIAVQVLTLGAVAWLLYQQRTRIWLSDRIMRCGRTVLLVLGVIIVMTLFPPVTRPWWGTPPPPADPAASTSLPPIAFLLHPGFDASQHVPQYAVNLPALNLEWITAMVGGAIACFWITRRSKMGGALETPAQ